MPATVEQTPAASVGKSYTFRCYIYHQKSTGLYVAECIDLDLMVKAKKANKAERELFDAVRGYVQIALQSGDGSLIPRRAPLTHCLRYHAVSFLSHFRKLADARIFDCTPPLRASCA
jgi:hypothetical protein